MRGVWHTYRPAGLAELTGPDYERPATIALLRDVHGRRVLEAGCAAGALTAMLADRGAEVTAST
jgi:2-polyprenyl-3-methyl-5-hydroxy-6-metoxy-1,4-benzoquinol methylase